MERLLQPGGMVRFKRGDARRSGGFVFAPNLTDIDEQNAIGAEALSGGGEMIGVVTRVASADRTPAELGSSVACGVSPNSMEA